MYCLVIYVPGSRRWLREHVSKVISSVNAYHDFLFKFVTFVLIFEKCSQCSNRFFFLNVSNISKFFKFFKVTVIMFYINVCVRTYTRTTWTSQFTTINATVKALRCVRMLQGWYLTSEDNVVYFRRDIEMYPKQGNWKKLCLISRQLYLTWFLSIDNSIYTVEL